MAERRARPPARPRAERPARDPARAVAYDLLRAVATDDAYANLLLPRLITRAGLSARDAALATELAYGTVRAAGTLDEILQLSLDRPVAALDAPVRDLLRLGAYQLLRTRIPTHAAVASTVDLARAVGQARASGLVNAVLRRVSGADWDAWTAELGADGPPVRALALRHAHPEWIAVAFARALADPLDGELAETGAALAADDERPETHLVAWPGLEARDELLAAGRPGRWSPYAVIVEGGDPGRLAAVRDHRAGVQDEGSQLVALALAAAPLPGRDTRWLDMCAGPGGKAALLAALAAPRGARLVANEQRPHRAELVRQAVRRFDVEVTVGDARALAAPNGGHDRVLLDAPCTGLGALRRRPEVRWRRRPGQLPELAALQGELLDAAIRLVRPGGVIAYATCSPHPAETVEVVGPRLAAGLVEALPVTFTDAAGAPVPDCAAPDGIGAQLWPHRHGTDAMYCALLRRL